MPYSTPISPIAGQGGPRAGFSTQGQDLLTGDARDAAGLPVVPTNTNNAVDGTANGLGKDEFLKLLLAQLSNQDPLKPLEDKEFIAQLAQFNALEQMQKVNQNLVDMLSGMSLATASEMIGKNVVALAGGAYITGTVTGVVMADGKAKLNIASGEDTVQVTLAQITEVMPAEEGSDVDTETESSSAGSGSTTP